MQRKSHSRTQGAGAVCKPRRDASPETNLELRLPASRSVGGQISVLKPPSLRCSVVEGQAKTVKPPLCEGGHSFHTESNRHGAPSRCSLHLTSQVTGYRAEWGFEPSTVNLQSLCPQPRGWRRVPRMPQDSLPEQALFKV